MKVRLVGFLCVLALSFYTYVPGYQKPEALFWDENFHIASAQRYLNGIFFMEPHPPLGKLIIAAGEALLHPNQQSNQFISLEKAENIPQHFSFAGFRLFPVLFGALVAPILFLLLLEATQSVPISFFISLAAVFDNTLIVHNRGAMLEAPQLFFILISLLCFFKLYHHPGGKNKLILSLLGIALAAACLIKINSAPFLLIPLVLLVRGVSVKQLVVYSLSSFLIFYLGVWQIHFALGSTVEPTLENHGYFNASRTLQDAINQKQTWNPRYLPQALYDAFLFSKKYQRGVPTLNYCKEGEAGSYPLLWPLGSKAIQYRWDDDTGGTRYLYLVPNPWGWAIGIVGILGALSLLISRFLGFSSSRKVPTGPLLLIVTLYFATWLAPLGMNRVFYLYHYFISLILSWIALGLVCKEVKQFGPFSTSSTRVQAGVSITNTVLLIASFIYISPLTYHHVMTEQELAKRNLISLWDIRCKHCGSQNPIAQPLRSDASQKRSDPEWKLSLGNVTASYIEQSAGVPEQILSDAFKIMTRSRIQFQLQNQYLRLSGIAALPSDHMDGELEFKLIGDGIEIWKSRTISAENPSEAFQISVEHVKVLVLVARTIQDLDPPSFGEWRNLKLEAKSID